MGLLRWCGRVVVGFGQWVVAFVVLADLSLVLPAGRGWFFARVYGVFVGSVVLTVWFRRWLRRRPNTARDAGREGGS